VGVVELHTRDWLSDPSLIADPFPYYEAVRAQGPIYREPSHGMFVVTGYDEMLEVYRDPETFSSCNVHTPLFESPGGPHGVDVTDVVERCRGQMSGSDSFITHDPPVHTEERGLMMRLLTPKRIEETADFIARLVDEQIDSFAAAG
jgi:cytochrome P450